MLRTWWLQHPCHVSWKMSWGKGPVKIHYLLFSFLAVRCFTSHGLSPLSPTQHSVLHSGPTQAALKMGQSETSLITCQQLRNCPASVLPIARSKVIRGKAKQPLTNAWLRIARWTQPLLLGRKRDLWGIQKLGRFQEAISNTINDGVGLRCHP